MRSGSQQSRRRKYSKNTNEHIFFALIVLLAAVIYANRLKKFARLKTIVVFVLIAIGIIGLIMVIKLLRKLTIRKPFIDGMSGLEFERYVASLLPRQGYSYVKLTERYDFGVDIIARKKDELWGIQVKRYSSPVKIDAVRQAVAALKHYGCDRAMVITNSSFSTSAQDLAKSNDCLLIDRQQLMQWAKDL